MNCNRDFGKRAAPGVNRLTARPRRRKVERFEDRGEGVNRQTKSGRPWLIALPTAGLVVLGLIWSAFWYYASDRAQAAMTAWRAREAEAGRVYGCADASFGGYPFRIEVSCRDPSMADRASALALAARNLAAVAQVWDPTLVIGEIAGPMTVGPYGAAPAVAIDWTLAQASLRGMPGAPERLAVVLDRPSLAALPPQAGAPLAKADHMEFHARFAADSAPGHRALDLALDLTRFTAPAGTALGAPLDALAAATTDASIVAVLRGAPDLAPKPLAQRLREIEAADGRLEIVNARLQQGDLIAGASGVLALTPRGTLNGEIRLTIVNFARLVPLLGIDRMVAQAVSPESVNRYAPALDRLLPGLGNMLRGGKDASAKDASAKDASAKDASAKDARVNVNASAAALGALALGGRETEFEGQRAVSLVLRFDDGAVSLGPLKFGRIAPLF